MTRIIESLAEVSDRYDALFCDLWGCLHNGLRPFPEAVAALAAFRESGGRVVLLTNSPRPSRGVVRQLDRMGLPREVYDVVASSGDAAQAGMMAGAVGRRVWHLGPEKDERFFTDLPDDLPPGPGVERVGLDAAEGIVCTGPIDEENDTPADYRPVFLKAKVRGLKLLCANPDIVVDQGDKRLYCAGALAALYEEMGGESLYFGKPHPPIYDLARRRLAALGASVANDRILAVGDGIATDVQGAIAEDIDAIFITGGIAAEETGTNRQPDSARLRAFLDRHKLSPPFAMGQLR
jgi:HAD superfamily hydrolase (TIGR01459 family)